MRRYHPLLILSILAMSAPAAVAQSDPLARSIASLNHKEAVVLSKGSERVQLGGSDMELGVELLVGQRAIEYLEVAKARHPERFEGMGKHLSEHGYVPTSRITVARLSRFIPAEAAPHVSDASFRHTHSTSTAEGVVITQSWDDGSDATWEGTVYVERFSDGAWTSSEGQLDIATGTWEAIWAEPIAGEGPGGDDPFPVDLRNGTSSPRQLLLAAAGSPIASRADYTQCMYPHTLLPWWQDWATCILAGAAGCGTTCALTGPGWPSCTSACTAGVFVACSIDSLVR